MLIKMFAQGHGADPKVRTKKKLWLGVGMAALGAAGLLVLAVLAGMHVSFEGAVNDYAHGLLFGISGGMLGAGFSTGFSAWQRLRDPEKMRKFEIKEKDERNLAIQGAAAKMTVVTVALLLYLLVLVSAFVYPEASVVFSLMACALFVIYFFYIYWYAKRM